MLSVSGATGNAIDGSPASFTAKGATPDRAVAPSSPAPRAARHEGLYIPGTSPDVRAILAEVQAWLSHSGLDAPTLITMEELLADERNLFDDVLCRCADRA
jgi:hypothetical protein